ncbi:hypothetical protein ACFSC3_08255 [Sphingomonas floccifaciens]|uniref:Uncharacterized protein n=1 Tax=Sphingomonas floccifaciens TaxID=1844115 RepID=A0ABW4NBP0_9SPHN
MVVYSFKCVTRNGPGRPFHLDALSGDDEARDRAIQLLAMWDAVAVEVGQNGRTFVVQRPDISSCSRPPVTDEAMLAPGHDSSGVEKEKQSGARP